MNERVRTRAAGNRDPLVFALLCLSIGSLYPATKVALRAFDPLTLVLVRLLIGASFLLAWSRFRRVVLPRRPRLLYWLAFAGATNAGCAFLLVTWGQQHVSASFAAILAGAGPAFTALGATLLLADEKLTRRRAFGIAVGFAGIVVLLGRQAGWSHVLGGSSALIGSGAILLGGVGLSAVAILVRTHLAALSPVQIALPMALSGLLFIALCTAVLAVSQPTVIRASVADPEALGAAVLLGLVNAGIGPVLYYGLILSWGASRTALLGYGVPLVGVALSFALLHDHLTVEMAVGLVLVTASFRWVSPLDRSPPLLETLAAPELPLAVSVPSSQTPGGFDA